MTDGYEKILKEFNENSGDGYFPNEIMTLRLMELDRLDRIANALEGIDNALEQLTECIGYIPPQPYQEEGCHIFRIGGGIDIGD